MQGNQLTYFCKTLSFKSYSHFQRCQVGHCESVYYNSWYTELHVLTLAHGRMHAHIGACAYACRCAGLAVKLKIAIIATIALRPYKVLVAHAEEGLWVLSTRCHVYIPIAYATWHFPGLCTCDLTCISCISESGYIQCSFCEFVLEQLSHCTVVASLPPKPSL